VCVRVCVRVGGGGDIEDIEDIRQMFQGSNSDTCTRLVSAGCALRQFSHLRLILALSPYPCFTAKSPQHMVAQMGDLASTNGTLLARGNQIHFPCRKVAVSLYDPGLYERSLGVFDPVCVFSKY
jgi:hypothetical protein